MPETAESRPIPEYDPDDLESCIYWNRGGFLPDGFDNYPPQSYTNTAD